MSRKTDIKAAFNNLEIDPIIIHGHTRHELVNILIEFEMMNLTSSEWDDSTFRTIFRNGFPGFNQMDNDTLRYEYISLYGYTICEDCQNYNNCEYSLDPELNNYNCWEK